MIVARGADFNDAYILMVRWHGGHGPGWHSSTHLWTHREVSSLTPPSFMLFFVLLNALPQTSPQLHGSFNVITVNCFTLMILILTSVECRVGSTPAPGPCGRSSGTAWRAASSAKASGSRGKPSCSLLTFNNEDSV